ncbi:MAG: protein-L-isoaspartate(D-aspartate) O-methyltransferase [Opitutales bacterium]
MVTDDTLKARRATMVRDQLKRRGIADPEVLRVMGTVPRHAFMPEEDQAFAYVDGARPLSHGQTISQPYIVALMTEALQPEPGLRVLEIGTGCGYQTAILAELGLEIWSVEIVEPLARSAREHLEALGYGDRFRLRVGDGREGFKAGAPFDRLICAAAVPEIPETWRRQLVPGGWMVLPHGPSGRGAVQQLKCIRKPDTEDGEWAETVILDVAFVPLTGEEGD